MKRIIFLSFFLFMGLIFVRAQENVCHANVSFNNWGDTLLVGIYTCLTNEESEDTIIGKDGTFVFDIPLKSVAIVTITTPAFMRNEVKDYQVDRFIFVPGETLNRKSDGSISGSMFYQQYSKAVAYRRSANCKLDSIYTYIARHADEDASMCIFADGLTSYTSENMQMAYAKLSPRVQYGRMKPLYNCLLSYEIRSEKNQKRCLSVSLKGVKAPDFQLLDIKGQKIRLSDFKGRYILLDFWGSWCHPCMQSLPNVEKLYERHKDKIVVIGICCNDKEQSWRMAVNRNKLKYINVFAPRNSTLSDDYFILEYPTLVLIDPEGNIVKRFSPQISGSESVYDLIDKL